MIREISAFSPGSRREVQTFLPYADSARSAQVLDPKRLGKQRVETPQVVRPPALARDPTLRREV